MANNTGFSTGAPSPEQMAANEVARAAQFAEFARALGVALWWKAADEQLHDVDIEAAYQQLQERWSRPSGGSLRCAFGWHLWSYLSPRNWYRFDCAIRSCSRCHKPQLVYRNPKRGRSSPSCTRHRALA